MSSTFDVPIVEVKLRPHPNADTLSIMDVFGWQVVVKTEEWKNGELAAFVRPDSVVPDLPEWAFLEGKRRIRTRRFRGEWSHGLITKRPEDAQLGDDVSRLLGIIPYEPPSARNEGRPSRARPKTWWARIVEYIKELGVRPRGRFPYYDVEHLRRYPDLIPEGTLVVITEKIHGANACYVYRKPWLGKARVFMRSRTVWRWPGENHWWKAALEATPAITQFLKAHPGVALYGEIYGKGVQDLTYGAEIPQFVAFDVWEGHEWWDAKDFFGVCALFQIPTVPLLYGGPFKMDKALELAEQNSRLAQREQLAEGVVVRTVGPHRKQLKLVSSRYLETADPK